MLHEPIQQQLARLGMRGAADALARLPLDDGLIDALATLLEAECLHRDSLVSRSTLFDGHLIEVFDGVSGFGFSIRRLIGLRSS